MRKALTLDLDRSLRIAYVAGALGAGVAGALALASPACARIALARPEPRLGARLGPSNRVESSLVGSVWLAMAGLSLLGLKRPRAMVAVPILQLAYKTVWLARTGVPSLLRGDRSVAPLVGVFGAWVLGLAAIRPWRVLAESSSEASEAPRRRITEAGLGPSSPGLELPDDIPSLL